MAADTNQAASSSIESESSEAAINKGVSLVPHLDFRFDARPTMAPMVDLETSSPTVIAVGQQQAIPVGEDDAETELVRAGYLDGNTGTGGLMLGSRGSVGGGAGLGGDELEAVLLSKAAAPGEKELAAATAARLRLSHKEATLVERVFRLIFPLVESK